MSRFERQITLANFGKEAQQKLFKAKVLVVGAGGLGCPILLYLAAAGVKTIAVADGDTVALSNLNRQIIFGEKDVNKLKVEVIAKYFKEKYSDISIITLPYFLTTENSIDIINQYDLIIDGTDNFETRYMVNDACVLLNKPLVFGAIYKNEGQVAVFNTPNKNGVRTNYRDVFPVPPSSVEIPNCSETGVLGVLPGTIGIIMATEAIKWLTGYGKTLANKMMIYDLLCHSLYEIDIFPNALNKHAPQTIQSFQKNNYKITCNSSVNIATNISWQKAIKEKEKSLNKSVLIDVRELHEEPKLSSIKHFQIPLQKLLKNKKVLQKYKTIYLFCQAGLRSYSAASELQKYFPDKKIHSIKGGISKLINTKNLKKHVS